MEHSRSASRSHQLVFLVLATGMTAVALPQSMIVPVLPSIQAEFDTDPVTATWLITAFLLSSSVATPLVGRLGDSYGQRRVLATALVVLAIGCAGGMLAPSIGWMIAARVVQGVGGGIVPVTFGILRTEYPPARLNHAVAVMATIGSIGFSFGIVFAGPLLDSFGHESLFVVPLLAALVALVGTVLVLPRSRRSTADGRFGVLPVALFSTGLVVLLYAIGESVSLGWFSSQVLLLCAAALVLMLAWIRVERRATVAFIDLVMMRRRGVWTSNTVAFLLGAALFGSAAALPQMLRAPAEDGFGVGASLTEVGWLMLPTAVFAFATSLFTGRLLRVFGTRTVLVAGLLATCGSFVGLAFWQDRPWLIIVWNTIQGIGNGLALSTLASVVVLSVPARQTGIANGMNTNIRTIGGSFGAGITAAIIGAHVAAGGATSQTGLVAALLVMAGLMALAVAVAVLVPVRGRAEVIEVAERLPAVPEAGLAARMEQH